MGDAGRDTSVTDRYLAKISQQADELLTQRNELTLQENKILELETQLSKCGFIPAAAGTSDLAKRRKDEAKHRDQLNALQRQLDTATKRLKESSMTKNQLTVDLEHKTRENRFMENRCDELQKENQKLMSQLEAVTTGPSSGPKSPAALKMRSQSLQEQLRAARDSLRLKDAETDRLARELEEGKMRLSTLEKALEFRADEVGLSGHADLLAKVAGFRGEVSALKKDLMDKRNKLHDIEAEKQTVSESNLTLQQQIAQLQERLAQSRLELQRVQKGESLLEQLRDTERERDVLLEFIQDDLKKNSDLTLAADKAMKEAVDASRRADSAQAQLKKQCELVDSQAQYIRDLEGKQAALHNERSATEDRLAAGARELEDVRARLQRRETEAQEQSKVNLTLLEQLKAKEESMTSLTSEVTSMRLQLEGLGSTVSRLQDERRDLDGRVKQLTAELVPLREESLMYASTANLRPEMESLQHDYDAVLTEKRELLEELQQLRFYDKQYRELRGELEKIKKSSEELQSPSGTAQKGDSELSSSQRHVRWTGIPALRQLSPILYENIRGMFQDLFNKESECRDLAALVKRYQDDQAYRDEDYRVDFQKMAELEEKMTRRTAEDRACIDAMDRELVRARSAKLIVEQIRLVLKSTLGDSATDYINHNSMRQSTNSRSATPAASSSRRNPESRGLRSARQFRDPLDDDHHHEGAYEYDESFTIKRNEDALNNSLEAIAGAEMNDIRNNENFGPSDSFRHNADEIFDSLSDEALPTIVSQALARHMSSVTTLDSCERQLRDAVADRDHLANELARSTAEASGLRQKLTDMQESSEGKEHTLNDKYRKMESDLSLAVSLNEKQNALTITLEAKIEELKRQLSVKSAQFISFQQQEEIFKFEFLNMFSNFWKAVVRKHGSLETTQQNWFTQANADSSHIDHIIESTAEILSAINFRLGKVSAGMESNRAQSPSRGLSSTPSFTGNRPAMSPPPTDVSHHYRHWNSGGTTRSPLTKQNQEYVEKVAKGGYRDNSVSKQSPSVLPHSLSQPFTRQEFRKFGGSKSFSESNHGDKSCKEFRLSPQRPSLQGGSSSQDTLGNNSEVLNRLQKAKTAYSFMRTDSLEFS